MSLQNSKERIIENFIVIWLDSDLNESDANFQSSLEQLRYIANSIKTFVYLDECIDYVSDIKNEKVFFIVNNILGEQLAPIIQPISHLYAIYIFSPNQTANKQWIKDYFKVKGIFNHIKSLCEILKRDIHQVEINLSPVNIISPSTTIDLNQLDQSFMYSQLLKKILLQMKDDEKLKTEFIEFCIIQHVENESALNLINEFDQDYRPQSSIWWYTRGCFIYSMLNKALRTQDIEIILKMGFFIRDLHQEIQRLYSTRNDQNPLTVYRGQCINNVQFERMKYSQGALLSFNNFLSTSIDRNIALLYADSARGDLELTGIIFRIQIDPSISTVPYISLDSISYYSDQENEILFSMHTIFRIGNINEIENRLWEIELTLTNDNDEQLKLSTDYLYKEIGAGTEWSQLAFLMLKMSELDKALEICQTIYNSTPNASLEFLAGLYNNIGCTMVERGEQRTGLAYQKIALEIFEKTPPSDPLHLVMVHNSTGYAHASMGEYSVALMHYTKALNIQQRRLPLYHPTIAKTFQSIAIAYQSMGDYSTALVNFDKALEVYKKSYPSNHPDTALIHNCVGALEQKMGRHLNAKSHYEKALLISEKTLPPNHPDLGMLHNNIGLFYQASGNYSMAHDHHMKALEIYQKSLSPQHSYIAMSHNNIGLLHLSMNDPSTALSHLNQAFHIIQKTLPSNHPNLVTSHINIGLVHYTLMKYSTALQHWEEAIKIQQQSLALNHPDLITSHLRISAAYRGLFNYEKVRRHLSAAIGIATHTFGCDHPDVQILCQQLEQLRRM